MLRRISKTFNRKRDSENINGHTNGQTHGYTNGASGKAAASTNGQVSASSSGHDSSKEISVTRSDVQSTFEQFAQLIHAAQRPLPIQSGDGSYLTKEESGGILADLKALGLRDIRTIRHIMEDKAGGKPQDDRLMHMEEVMQLVAALPSNSGNRVQLTSMFLDELWNSLQHPPMSYLGDKYLYRSADGSNNSFTFPLLGAANTPYARSIPRKFLRPLGPVCC
jgi:linoleate 10R-lipoxygenase